MNKRLQSTNCLKFVIVTVIIRYVATLAQVTILIFVEPLTVFPQLIWFRQGGLKSKIIQNMELT